MENNSKIHVDERIDHGRSEKVAYTETGSNLGCQTGGEVMQRQQFPIKHFMGQCCNFKFSPAVRVRNQEEMEQIGIFYCRVWGKRIMGAHASHLRPTDKALMVVFIREVSGYGALGPLKRR